MTEEQTGGERVVDAWNRGWARLEDGLFAGYDLGMPVGFQWLPPRPLDQIVGETGGVRPVIAMTEVDRERVYAALELAGEKAVGTVAAAVDLVRLGARRRYGRRPAGDEEAGAYAVRTLTAGYPESWESEALLAVADVGQQIQMGGRRRGPRQRVVREACDAIVAVLDGWTTGADGYTEVAVNLAWTVSAFADLQHGADGWSRVADGWLRPGTPWPVQFDACYRLLYRKSEYFDADYV